MACLKIRHHVAVGKVGSLPLLYAVSHLGVVVGTHGIYLVGEHLSCCCVVVKHLLLLCAQGFGPQALLAGSGITQDGLIYGLNVVGNCGITNNHLLVLLLCNGLLVAIEVSL